MQYEIDRAASSHEGIKLQSATLNGSELFLSTLGWYDNYSNEFWQKRHITRKLSNVALDVLPVGAYMKLVEPIVDAADKHADRKLPASLKEAQALFHRPDVDEVLYPNPPTNHAEVSIELQGRDADIALGGLRRYIVSDYFGTHFGHSEPFFSLGELNDAGDIIETLREIEAVRHEYIQQEIYGSTAAKAAQATPESLDSFLRDLPTSATID